MNPLLIFVAACTAIALVGWIVSKITGAHAWFIEDWKFNDGESILWRDDAADVAMIPQLAQAVIMRPPRLHRWTVIVTNQRIIIGNKTLTGKKMVNCVLYPGSAPDGQSKRTDGGLFTRGYSTVVIQPGVMETHPDQKLQPPYIALKPVANEQSSFNLAEIRIYTDSFASFRLE